VSTRPFTVLVVDDHAPFRAAARAMLEVTPGCVGIASVASGEEALVIVDKLRPDVVLLDVNMAGLNGIETSRRLTAGRPDTVVVLVSSDDDPELVAVPSACGAAAFFPKDKLRPSVVTALWARHAPACADTGRRQKRMPEPPPVIDRPSDDEEE
jgi:DNA-binding NarL/FixJ family response regulator